jgi:hypothetical protein
VASFSENELESVWLYAGGEGGKILAICLMSAICRIGGHHSLQGRPQRILQGVPHGPLGPRTG